MLHYAARLNKMVVDIIGRELAVGDCVSWEGGVYKIKKFTPKMVAIENLRPMRWSKSGPCHKYASELTLLPEQDVMLWILKNPK